MGRHLYIQEIATDQEIKNVPRIGVAFLEEYKIKTKKELEAFLIFHRMQGECQLQLKIQELEYLKLYKGNYFADDSKQLFIDILLERYRWHNNVSFNREKKGNGKYQATIYMMEFEIENHKDHMVTQEIIDKILELFVEGEHYAITI